MRMSSKALAPSAGCFSRDVSGSEAKLRSMVKPQSMRLMDEDHFLIQNRLQMLDELEEARPYHLHDEGPICHAVVITSYASASFTANGFSREVLSRNDGFETVLFVQGKWRPTYNMSTCGWV